MKLVLGLCVFFFAGCSGDDSTSLDEALGDPKAVEVGFNMGRLDQFDYLGDYYAKDKNAQRLCHTYTSWKVANEAPAAGNPNAPQPSRAWLTYWLSQAQGRCDEVMVSFQAHDSNPTNAPSPADFETAFRNFVTASWPYKGKFSFTPWNEPNNGASAGDGLGKQAPANVAADYYLTAEEICKNHGCKVAAGDLASNGNMWHDFDQNCSSDIVAPKDLCSAASWLDRYKNYIANFADGTKSPLGRTHHLKQGFRPEYFAFHGWHDINMYLSEGSHCSSTNDCVTRVLLKSLGGSWSGVQIWDTETGIDQDADPISDGEQACGAAFLLRSSALSARIKRIYITRLHGGSGELFTAPNKARAAANVLALHEAFAPNQKCK